MESPNEIKSVFWIGTFVMLFLAFGLIFIVLFYKNYFSKIKRQEAELLLKTALESEKQERKRIASDLHDSVSSDLSAIRNYLVYILKKEKDEEQIKVLNELREGVNNAIENTRLVSYKLMPPLLDKFGFTATLEDYIKRLNNSQYNFEFINTESTFMHENNVAYELFRIVQEFTTNMMKYGEIKNCKILLSKDNLFTNLELIDDGKCFNFNAEKIISKGSGINNINSRIKLIKAKLEQIDTNNGNHFKISIPIEKVKKT